jgi:UDP-glucose 4-epimerase
VLEYCAKFGKRVLIASTSEVYGLSEKVPFREDGNLVLGATTKGRWSYACSKAIDEFLALAYWKERQLPTVVVRLFNTVGPRQTGQYGMVLPRFIAAAQSGKPLKVFGDGQQSRCFCWVGDTVEALVRLQNCSEARGQVFNVGGTEEIKIHDLAMLVTAVLKSDTAIELVPYSKAYEPGFDDMRRRKPMTEKLDATIGFRPNTPLRSIIERTAASAPLK